MSESKMLFTKTQLKFQYFKYEIMTGSKQGDTLLFRIYFVFVVFVIGVCHNWREEVSRKIH